MAVYIVFDVETPNRANDRMSAIGISAIKDNKIVANYFSLVDPETHFDYFNTKLTGIDADKVKGAPNFAELWKKIEPIMSKGILVAHNAVFDMSVLRACLWFCQYHLTHFIRTRIMQRERYDHSRAFFELPEAAHRWRCRFFC